MSRKKLNIPKSKGLWYLIANQRGFTVKSLSNVSFNNVLNAFLEIAPKLIEGNISKILNEKDLCSSDSEIKTKFEIYLENKENGDLGGIFDLINESNISSESRSFERLKETLSLNKKFTSLKDKSDFSTEEKIEYTHNLISICCILNSTIKDETIKKCLTEIRNSIVYFIGSDSDICKAEDLEESPLDEIDRGDAIIGRNGKKTEILKHLTKKSLLCSLFSIVADEYIEPIIAELISGSKDLSKRDDLILMLIDQKTISNTDYMSKIFDMMIEKKLPPPSKEQIKVLITDTRLNSGNNASKLAAGFFNMFGNELPSNYVLECISELSNKNNNLRSKSNKTTTYSEEKDSLKKLLATNANGGAFFEKKLRYFLEKSFGDKYLVQLLETHKTENHSCIKNIKDHGEILNFAVQKKLIVTFGILIDKGFDPSRHPEGKKNIIAIASQTQSAKPINHYIDAITKKFPKDFVKSLIKEKDFDGKTALTHALENKAFIDTIGLLLKNGDGYKDEEYYIYNLDSASKQENNSGAFDFLLSKAPKKILEKFIPTLKNNTGRDWVINKIILEKSTDLENSFKENLETEIKTKVGDLKNDDIFRICKNCGEKTLKYYFEAMRNKDYNYDSRSEVLKTDGDKKTPLYYAVSINAFNGIIKSLLDEGANPNNIGKDDNEEEIDALSIAVENNETETVGLLLKSGFIKENLINKVANTLFSEGSKNNNYLLHKSFIENLPIKNLNHINNSTLTNIISTILDYEQLDKNFILKIKESGKFGTNKNSLEKLITKLIKNKNSESLDTLLKYFPLNFFDVTGKNDLYSNTNQKTDEKTPLILNNPSPIPKSTEASNMNSKKIFSTADSSNSSQNFSKELLNDAVKEAISKKEPDQINLIKVLIRHNFPHSGSKAQFEKDIRSLGINTNDCFSRMGCAIS